MPYYRSYNNYAPKVYKPSCVGQCVHVDLTDDLIELALYEERQLANQKGDNNPTTLVLSKRRDFTGSLAQNGVLRAFEVWGIAPEAFSPYYNPKRNNDDFDLMHRGLKADVSGGDIGSFPDGTPVIYVYPKTHHTVANHKQNRPMDAYIMCKVDAVNNVLHIAGVIGYHEFWSTATPNGEHTHFVTTAALKDFRQWAFGL